MVSHETQLSCPTCRHMKAAKYFNSTLPCPKHLNNSRCCWCGHKLPDVEVKPKYNFDPRKFFLFVCCCYPKTANHCRVRGCFISLITYYLLLVWTKNIGIDWPGNVLGIWERESVSWWALCNLHSSSVFGAVLIRCGWGW